MGGNIPSEDFLAGNFPRERGRGGREGRGDFPGGLMNGNFSGVNSPGRNYPRTIFFI